MFNEPDDRATAGNPGAAILPAQYFGNAKGRKLLEGEYRLLLAVLEQAVRSYLASMKGRTGQQRLDFEELRRWFYAPRSTAPQGLFAFESICDLLGIDADMLRRRLGSISIRDLPTHRQRIRHSLALGQRRARRQRTAALESAA
jgi:hypothetical protein